MLVLAIAVAYLELFIEKETEGFSLRSIACSRVIALRPMVISHSISYFSSSVLSTMNPPNPLPHLFALLCLRIAISYSPLAATPSSLTSLSQGADQASAPTNTTTLALLPFTQLIPDTPYMLHLGFSIFRKHLSRYEVGAILAIATDDIEHKIQQEGEHTLLPREPGYRRRYFEQYLPGPQSVKLSVKSVDDEDDKFDLEFVKDVIRGLTIFLLDKKRYWCTEFVVSTGHITDEAVAKGNLRLIDKKVADN